MKLSSTDILSKVHLVISICVVVPIALIYGFKPEAFLELFPTTTDEHNFYKAIMGLYLGCSIVWILGIFKTQMLKTALVTNVVFMLGLALGRFMSMIIDGQPSFVYVLGGFAELTLGFYGVWVLNRIYSKKL